MPTLTYQLCHEVSSKRDEEAAANAALAWYQQQLTKSATEQVAQALDNEPKANPETLQTLINDSVAKAVEKKVASAQTKLTQTIQQNLQKNLTGSPPSITDNRKTLTNSQVCHPHKSKTPLTPKIHHSKFFSISTQSVSQPTF